jgi:hypothetical protein
MFRTGNAINGRHGIKAREARCMSRPAPQPASRASAASEAGKSYKAVLQTEINREQVS